jgi:transmembrane 9 superfamily protein 2/4
MKLTKGEKIEIQAGSLSSKKSIIPFGYNKLEICHSKKNDKIYTLGEIITGEELFSTDYFANINENKYCQNICYNEFEENTINSIKKLIKREYYSNWYIDNLPAGLLIYDSEKKKYKIDYFKGIPLGFIDKTNKKFYIYNHLQFHILIKKIENNKYNIVGFNILPLSIKYNIMKIIIFDLKNFVKKSK